MAVALRLNRQGAKDRPYYKIVAVDQRKRRDGRYIEQIGTYDPMVDGDNYTLDLAKAEKWLSVGARPSDTVRSLIRKARTKATTDGPAEPTVEEKPEPVAAEAPAEPKAEEKPEPVAAEAPAEPESEEKAEPVAEEAPAEPADEEKA